jgi:Dihydrofolate reductase
MRADVTLQLLQVYQEALQSAECSVVHLTQIEGEYPCDTFFPPLDGAQYRLWSASAPQRHKDDRYSFLCYTRADASGAVPRLPPGLASRHEEHQVHHAATSVACAVNVQHVVAVAGSTLEEHNTSSQWRLGQSFRVTLVKACPSSSFHLKQF